MLNTANAGGLTGNGSAKGTVKVRMLISSYVESCERDVKAGEIVDVSKADASFLIPYAYATTDLADVDESELDETAPDGQLMVEGEGEGEGAAKVKVESKRRR